VGAVNLKSQDCHCRLNAGHIDDKCALNDCRAVQKSREGPEGCRCHDCRSVTGIPNALAINDAPIEREGCCGLQTVTIDSDRDGGQCGPWRAFGKWFIDWIGVLRAVNDDKWPT
jgi:hypothetical protein